MHSAIGLPTSLLGTFQKWSQASNFNYLNSNLFVHKGFPSHDLFSLLSFLVVVGGFPLKLTLTFPLGPIVAFSLGLATCCHLDQQEILYHLAQWQCQH